MSAAHAYSRVQRAEPHVVQPRPQHLRAVAAPAPARSLVPFITLCITIMIAAVAAVLYLNTEMAAGSYEQRQLRLELIQLHEDSARLHAELEANSAPQRLAESASGLGMQQASRPGFISLEKETVLRAAGD